MLLVTNVLMADDNSRRVSKTFDVGNFTALEVNIPCDIVYEPSFGSKLEISALSEDALSNIIAEVKDNTLILKMEAGNIFKSLKSVDVYVGSKKLNAVKVNGAADFEAKRGILASDEFKLQVNGSGDVEIETLRVPQLSIVVNGAADLELSDLNCDQLDLQINGAGDCDLDGKAKVVNIKVNGAGDVNISDLKTEKVNSSIRGAGSVR